MDELQIKRSVGMVEEWVRTIVADKDFAAKDRADDLREGAITSLMLLVVWSIMWIVWVADGKVSLETPEVVAGISLSIATILTLYRWPISTVKEMGNIVRSLFKDESSKR